MPVAEPVWWCTVRAVLVDYGNCQGGSKQEELAATAQPCYLLWVMVKAGLTLSFADILIKQTHIGQAGKKQFANLFHELSEVPTLCLFRFNTPWRKSSLETQWHSLAQCCALWEVHAVREPPEPRTGQGTELKLRLRYHPNVELIIHPANFYHPFLLGEQGRVLNYFSQPMCLEYPQLRQWDPISHLLY